MNSLYTTNSVISKDGTSIGYRQYGNGPGIILVQGAMGFAENFSTLAEALSKSFTVYVPDRRGRGMSPLPYEKNHSIKRDVEDLEALLKKTGTHFVFALSSGAVIALAAALQISDMKKLAIFEPPLFENQTFPEKELEGFNKAMDLGDIASAMTSAGKAVNPAIKLLPDWLLNFFLNQALAGEAKNTTGSEPGLKDMALSLQYDFHVITEMYKTPKLWNSIQCGVLLMGGGKSPGFLKSDLNFLEKVIPNAGRITLKNAGHSVSWNYDKKRNPGANPEMVSQELLKFFSL